MKELPSPDVAGMGGRCAPAHASYVRGGEFLRNQGFPLYSFIDCFDIIGRRKERKTAGMHFYFFQTHNAFNIFQTIK
jgi:hypothetical protein